MKKDPETSICFWSVAPNSHGHPLSKASNRSAGSVLSEPEGLVGKRVPWRCTMTSGVSRTARSSCRVSPPRQSSKLNIEEAWNWDTNKAVFWCSLIPHVLSLLGWWRHVTTYCGLWPQPQNGHVQRFGQSNTQRKRDVIQSLFFLHMFQHARQTERDNHSIKMLLAAMSSCLLQALAKQHRH